MLRTAAKNLLFYFLVSGVVLLIGPFGVAADVPNQMNYQDFLGNPDGSAVDDSLEIMGKSVSGTGKPTVKEVP